MITTNPAFIIIRKGKRDRKEEVKQADKFFTGNGAGSKYPASGKFAASEVPAQK